MTTQKTSQHGDAAIKTIAGDIEKMLQQDRELEHLCPIAHRLAAKLVSIVSPNSVQSPQPILPTRHDFLENLLVTFAWIYTHKQVSADANVRIWRWYNTTVGRQLRESAINGSAQLSELVATQLKRVRSHAYIADVLSEAAKTFTLDFCILAPAFNNDLLTTRPTPTTQRVVVGTSAKRTVTLDRFYIAAMSMSSGVHSALTDVSTIYILEPALARAAALVHRVSRIETFLKSHICAENPTVCHFPHWAWTNKTDLLAGAITFDQFKSAHSAVFAEIHDQWQRHFDNLTSCIDEILLP